MSFLRKLFHLDKKKVTKKNSITGRNHTFEVPYLSRLEGTKLLPGQSLIFRGIITSPQDFIINFTDGGAVELDEDTTKLDNRLLSMRVDMASKQIYFNACIDDEWGKTGIVKHDWVNGDEFDIRIRAYDKLYEIFVDHKLIAKFAHYKPLSDVTHVYVNGGITLYMVNYEGKFYSIPYGAEIPGCFVAGKKLFVSGLIKKTAKSFDIELQARDGVALRMRILVNDKKMFCNSQIDSKWGSDQRISKQTFPFKRKRTFDLLVYCEESKFILYVNDCLLGSYEHRLNCADIDKVSIDGDIILLGVHLK
uniref:Galectin n=1 Tax=Rhabditophanes sp. KR3021 TaxID=114890 RepID=A0AC35TJH7_9BILA